MTRPSQSDDLVVREYGIGTEPVITLLGGPAAAGDVAPVARELGQQWPVLEPFRRGSGGRPLTVATHVQDLDDLVRDRCGGHRPVLVGHSWGAMLALAYAAAHPATAAGLVLVGCGTFSIATRVEFEARLEARLTPADRANIAFLRKTEPNADRRRAAMGRLMTRVYGHDLEEVPDEVVAVGALAHEQTWADMVRLQRDGIYPAAFAAIPVPVLMLHGDRDPHPGRLISEELQRYIPHLEYHELDMCGHSPWLERQAKQLFFQLLSAWIAGRFQAIS